MPIIKSAKKKLRKDKKKTARNIKYEKGYKKQIKKLKKRTGDKKSVNLTFSMIDKTAKKGIIHKNKAKRLKSRVAKLVKNKWNIK